MEESRWGKFKCIDGYLNVFDVKTCVCLKKNFCKKLMLKCENFVEISFDIKCRSVFYEEIS